VQSGNPRNVDCKHGGSRLRIRSTRGQPQASRGQELHRGSQHVKFIRPFDKTRRARSRGQTLVEFALVFPIFIVMLLAIMEFAFVFNAVLSANYATRDASLVAAEAGSNKGADCTIIAKILEDMRAPADSSNISQIIIYRANPAGAPYNGSYTGSGNVWVRDNSGPTDCTAYGGPANLPYVMSAGNYAEGLPNLNTGVGGRCDYLNGCPNNTDRPRDAVGVQITYNYSWITPLRNFINTGGSGYTIVRSNEMRMEPIL
jgi:hypothetical protein